MADILLTSEKFVKSVTSISDNVAGQYLLPSIREAQEMGLRRILGDALLERLKGLVQTIGQRGSFSFDFSDAFDVDPNSDYRALLDHCQYYLAYMAVVELCGKVSYKIVNMGVVRTSDERVQPVSHDEMSKTEYYWQSKADAYAYELQRWLLEHRTQYPELAECHCARMRSNLRSAATCGLWLGGARGRRKRGGRCR